MSVVIFLKSYILLATIVTREREKLYPSNKPQQQKHQKIVETSKHHTKLKKLTYFIHFLVSKSEKKIFLHFSGNSPLISAQMSKTT